MKKSEIAKIESALTRGADDYFRQNGFIRIPTVPHMVGITGACENVDTLFELKGEEIAYLTQTGQLSLELLVPDLHKVCTEIHSFRAETADKRHLREFPLIEFEFEYKSDGLNKLLDHIEGTVKQMINNALNTQINLNKRVYQDIKKSFVRIPYKEAISELNKTGYNLKFGADLKHDHEQKIIELTGKPTFITHYPESIKFFNMRRNRQNKEVVNSADLILPVSGEAVGSAEREHDPNLLEQKLVESPMYKMLLTRGQTKKDFKWYLNAVKKNPVPHAGCGIGLTRITQYLLNADDIRNATTY